MVKPVKARSFTVFFFIVGSFKNKYGRKSTLFYAIKNLILKYIGISQNVLVKKKGK